MKLTDFALIFVVVAGCLFYRIRFQNELMWENVYGNTMYNQIMDNIAEDALSQVISFQDNRPFIQHEALTEAVLNGISAYTQDESQKELYQNRIKMMIVTLEDGYYLWGISDEKVETGEHQWSDKILYTQGKLTKREDKVNAILKQVDEEIGIDLILPSIEGEALENTIEDYSFIVIYQSYPYVFRGKVYEKYVFSGAKMEYQIYFS